MIYQVKIGDQILYHGTSIEDAAAVAKSHPGAESFTEGVKIEWLPKTTATLKRQFAVTAKTLTTELVQPKPCIHKVIGACGLCVAEARKAIK